ncbi:MAG: hypothetical protein V5A44_08685 [Haloarculaceae archaeon]
MPAGVGHVGAECVVLYDVTVLRADRYAIHGLVAGPSSGLLGLVGRRGAEGDLPTDDPHSERFENCTPVLAGNDVVPVFHPSRSLDRPTAEKRLAGFFLFCHLAPARLYQVQRDLNGLRIVRRRDPVDVQVDRDRAALVGLVFAESNSVSTSVVKLCRANSIEAVLDFL